MDIIVIIFIGLFRLSLVSSDCLFIPSWEYPFFMICQGREVSSFPQLSSEQKAFVETIVLSETFITSLPLMNETEYDTLKLFEESGNVLLNCSHVDNWKRYQSDTVFITECEELASSTSIMTNSIISTTASDMYNSDASSSKDDLYKSSIFTTDFQTNTDTIEEQTTFHSVNVTEQEIELESNNDIIIIIAMFSLIILVIIISVLYSIHKRYQIDTKSSRNEIEMRVLRNDNYRHSLRRIYNPTVTEISPIQSNQRIENSNATTTRQKEISKNIIELNEINPIESVKPPIDENDGKTLKFTRSLSAPVSNQHLLNVAIPPRRKIVNNSENIHTPSKKLRHTPSRKLRSPIEN